MCENILYLLTTTVDVMEPVSLNDTSKLKVFKSIQIRHVKLTSVCKFGSGPKMFPDRISFLVHMVLSLDGSVARCRE